MSITTRNVLHDMSIKETFTASWLIKKRGWTKGLIKKWLVPIPKTEFDYYSSVRNPKTLLYFRDEVYRVESCKEFQKQFNRPRKTPLSKSSKTLNNFAEIFQNMGVVYVNSFILNELVENYIDIYISSNPHTLNNATSDKYFTEKCSYIVIRDVLSTYREDMEILKKNGASTSILKTYNDQLRDLILQRYPNLKGAV